MLDEFKPSPTLMPASDDEDWADDDDVSDDDESVGDDDESCKDDDDEGPPASGSHASPVPLPLLSV